MLRYRKLSGLMILMLMLLNLACSAEINGQGGDGSVVKPPAQTGDGGYLFAHMTHARYGSLFYSVSRDGVSWTTLNGGNVILSDYYGHPDICEGPDVFGDAPRRWYMIGVVKGSVKETPVLWHSTDLVVWKRKDIDGENFVVDHLGVYNEIPFVGAPKMFYDEASCQFLITWHAGEYMKQYREMAAAGVKGPELEAISRKNWETERTCYTLTKDFVEFTRPKKLFADQNAGDEAPLYFTGADEGIGLIDVIIRKFDGKYYAIVKDERWEDKAPATHKAIRIASSNNLLGPYTNPGPIISPNWREAPIMIRTKDGKFRVYYENYGEHVYEMREATAIQGAQWKDVKLSPPNARHGCIISVDEQVYQNILDNYRK